MISSLYLALVSKRQYLTQTVSITAFIILEPKNSRFHEMFCSMKGIFQCEAYYGSQ